MSYFKISLSSVQQDFIKEFYIFFFHQFVWVDPGALMQPQVDQVHWVTDAFWQGKQDALYRNRINKHITIPRENFWHQNFQFFRINIPTKVKSKASCHQWQFCKWIHMTFSYLLPWVKKGVNSILLSSSRKRSSTEVSIISVIFLCFYFFLDDWAKCVTWNMLERSRRLKI